jgi:hypothetical protein
MPSAILDGLSLVDVTGRLILAAILASLLLGIAANLFLRARYARLEADLRRSRSAVPGFSHPVLNRIVREANQSLGRSRELNTQGIIEESFQAELGPLLLAERFVRSATGLVIILGLLGTFYGLTLSIGKLVHLVSTDASGTLDVAQGLTTGLTHALAGMAVAFSNSLFGVASAVVLTVIGVFSNVTDRRTALMIEIEGYLDRVLVRPLPPGADAARGDSTERLERVITGFGDSVARLEGAVAQFDGALQTFAGNTRDFQEFNLHLKDNVQRMSLHFGDFSETLKTQVAVLKARNGS